MEVELSAGPRSIGVAPSTTTTGAVVSLVTGVVAEFVVLCVSVTQTRIVFGPSAAPTFTVVVFGAGWFA